MAGEERVARHYGKAGIAAWLIAALREAHGPDAEITPETMAPFDHFHGRGVQATKELAALLAPRTGESLIDIGCGIGGPARWMAVTFGVAVTGVDLTPEFCAAAQELTRAAGLADRVTILQGSALALPVPDAAFDRAYSQNVMMNIADKPGFYREAFRALRPGGVLALSTLCSGANPGPLHFPVPWASEPAASFLCSLEEMEVDLQQAGFEIVSLRDTTADILPAQRRHRERLEAEGLPAQGVHVIMGEPFLEMQINSSRNLEERRAATVEALLRKPG
ncbi:MAG: methyltransferase domain-containing protein [Alphaproteobacteria bacterium]|nr:methyltransferase domain-containing protein [Alphaproteobacteria bacterium]